MPPVPSPTPTDAASDSDSPPLMSDAVGAPSVVERETKWALSDDREVTGDEVFAWLQTILDGDLATGTSIIKEVNEILGLDNFENDTFKQFIRSIHQEEKDGSPKLEPHLKVLAKGIVENPMLRDFFLARKGNKIWQQPRLKSEIRKGIHLMVILEMVTSTMNNDPQFFAAAMDHLLGQRGLSQDKLGSTYQNLWQVYKKTDSVFAAIKAVSIDPAMWRRRLQTQFQGVAGDDVAQAFVEENKLTSYNASFTKKCLVEDHYLCISNSSDKVVDDFSYSGTLFVYSPDTEILQVFKNKQLLNTYNTPSLDAVVQELRECKEQPYVKLSAESLRAVEEATADAPQPYAAVDKEAERNHTGARINISEAVFKDMQRQPAASGNAQAGLALIRLAEQVGYYSQYEKEQRIKPKHSVATKNKEFKQKEGKGDERGDDEVDQ